jgi:hypothetical protein
MLCMTMRANESGCFHGKPSKAMATCASGRSSSRTLTCARTGVKPNEAGGEPVAWSGGARPMGDRCSREAKRAA